MSASPYTVFLHQLRDSVARQQEDESNNGGEQAYSCTEGESSAEYAYPVCVRFEHLGDT
ncbi:hypothetical protein D3C87_2095090 [compost metagenome]